MSYRKVAHEAEDTIPPRLSIRIVIDSMQASSTELPRK